jgi:hypothetical protein
LADAKEWCDVSKMPRRKLGRAVFAKEPHVEVTVI